MAARRPQPIESSGTDSFKEASKGSRVSRGSRVTPTTTIEVTKTPHSQKTRRKIVNNAAIVVETLEINIIVKDEKTSMIVTYKNLTPPEQKPHFDISETYKGEYPKFGTAKFSISKQTDSVQFVQFSPDRLVIYSYPKFETPVCLEKELPPVIFTLFTLDYTVLELRFVTLNAKQAEFVMAPKLEVFHFYKSKFEDDYNAEKFFKTLCGIKNLFLDIEFLKLELEQLKTLLTSREKFQEEENVLTLYRIDPAIDSSDLAWMVKQARCLTKKFYFHFAGGLAEEDLLEIIGGFKDVTYYEPYTRNVAIINSPVDFYGA